ncbi:LysR family transcriptional regulator [Rubritalea sp.]|uniref:LysR family transcriptional regulator n=1 Tax=Rubritalea sp. TaxID=2109375 RepID=UPI003EF5757E
MIELRHFQHFIAVANSNGIRQAARTIHISPSSLTRSIQFLEEYYGAVLLQRHGRQMFLTPHGEQVLKEVKTILQSVEAIKPKLAQFDSIDHGSLRVGLNPTIADMLQPKLGTRFIKEYPKVEITTVLGNVMRLMELLANGELDLIIGIDQVLKKERQFEVISLLETEALWWVRKNHPLLKKDHVSLSDFVDYPLLSQFLPPIYQEHLHELCREDGIAVKDIHRAHECDDYRALYLMATQSDAILLSHAFINHNDYFTDQLCQLRSRQQMPNAQFSIALPLQPIPSPLARRYVEILQEETKLLTC